MVGIKQRFKLILGIFIPFLLISLMSQNTFAVSLSGFNFLKVSYSYNGGSFQELIRHNSFLNLPDTLLAVPANTTNDRLKYFVVSGNLPSSNTGLYFNGKVYYEILANADNSFNSSNCMGLSGYIFPEQGSISESDSRVECSVSNSGRILNVVIITTGKLTTEATPTTWYSKVGNDDNYLFSCSSAAGSMSAPCRQQEIKINSATLSFNLSRDQTVAGLDNIINQNQTIINQNETIINNQNQNTQDIINNQNQNTQDIIRSNQKCRPSVNKLDLPDGTYTNNGITWTRSNGSLHGVGTLSTQTYSSSTSGNGYMLNLPSGTYTFSFNNPLGSPLRVEFSTRDNDNNRYNITVPVNSKSVTRSFSNGLKVTNISFVGGTIGEDYDILIENIQIQEGSSVTAFEPYGEDICKNINEEYYDEQRQADQNISNQTPSDIQGAENQATTNLIGVLGGFISAFSNINATNCNLTLDFPNYAGGSRVVDICQGKERAPRIVEIGSSLLLISVFVPLAYILIKMIYNEIRSWTNG